MLLLVGPALAWAAIPLSFTPFAHSPLRSVGWEIELYWLPFSAFLSTAVLYYVHRKRRQRLLEFRQGRGVAASRTGRA